LFDCVIWYMVHQQRFGRSVPVAVISAESGSSLLLLGELDLLDGVGGQGRRGGKVSTLRPETVLVGDVVDGVDDAVGAGVRVGALGDLSLSLGSAVLHVALFLGGDAVSGGEAETCSSFS
jgi:hypothetical protein